VVRKTTKRVLNIKAEVTLKVPVTFRLEVPKDFDPDRDTLGITPEVEARALACSVGVLQNGQFETDVSDWWVES
jgi:hypothetical protein